MIPFNQIVICKADAINYYKGGDKDFLKKIFLNDETFHKILERSIYFLLGDKGTGKTAFAVFTSNNETEELKSTLKFTSETDFKKFIRLIDQGKINISDFVSIWKVILLMMISQEIKSVLTENYISKYFLLNRIDSAINHYYKSAFSPEITNAIEIIDKAELFLGLLKNFTAKIDESKKVESNGMQINLFEIENEFKKALKGIKINKNFILFIDGTDQIPFDVKREKYLECLRGLANAIWELNQLVFPELLDNHKHYFKIVLLIRPDIFSLIRFHNANAKLKDNSVILNWITSENRWKTSRLFKIADNLLSSQQSSKYALGFAWQKYVDDEFELTINGRITKSESFAAILKRTFMRPRDIFAFMEILYSNAMKKGCNKINSEVFNGSLFEYSKYLLGEIKDQFNFFHEDHEWQILMDFVKYFNGRIKFDFEFFKDCYDRFINDYPVDNPDIFDTVYILMEELFSYNIICYIEESSGEDFYRWSYKEKSQINLFPTVEFDAEYSFHIGLIKALGLGKPIIKRRH